MSKVWFWIEMCVGHNFLITYWVHDVFEWYLQSQIYHRQQYWKSVKLCWSFYVYQFVMHALRECDPSFIFHNSLLYDAFNWIFESSNSDNLYRNSRTQLIRCIIVCLSFCLLYSSHKSGSTFQPISSLKFQSSWQQVSESTSRRRG
jgi:hypothetical protein